MKQYSNILKQADIFYQLTPFQLEMLANLCYPTTFDAGEIIFQEGSHGDELYIILQGVVEILVNPALISGKSVIDPTPMPVAVLQRGQSFGEIALVDQGLRSATAKASQNNTCLLVFSRQELMLLCGTYPELGFRLMRNLASDLALKMRNLDLKIRQEHLKAHKAF